MNISDFQEDISVMKDFLLHTEQALALSSALSSESRLTLIRVGFLVHLKSEGGLNQPTGLFELLWPCFTPKSVQTESQIKLYIFTNL